MCAVLGRRVHVRRHWFNRVNRQLERGWGLVFFEEKGLKGEGMPGLLGFIPCKKRWIILVLGLQ